MVSPSRASPAATLGAANLIAQALSFVNGLLMARGLGTVGRGQVALVAAYDDISTNGLTLGVPVGVGYFVTQPSDDAALRERRLLGAALKVSFWSTAAAIVLGWLVYEFAVAGSPEAIRWIVFAAIGTTPVVNTVPMAARMILMARGQLRRMAAVAISVTLMRLLAFLGLIVAGEFSAVTAAVAFIGGGWASNALALVVTGVRPSMGEPVGPLLRFGSKTIVASLSTMANSRVDQVLIAAFVGTGELGIYAVAVGISFVPQNVASSLSSALYRESAHDSVDRRLTTRRVRRAIKFSLAAAAVSAIGAAATIPILYGSDFRGAIVPAVILCFASAALGASSILVGVGNSTGHPEIGSWSSFGALLVTGFGLAVALPLLGIVGAALVTLAAYSVRWMVADRMCRTRAITFVK